MATDVTGIEREVLPMARAQFSRTGAASGRVGRGVLSIVAGGVGLGERVSGVLVRQVLHREAQALRRTRSDGERKEPGEQAAM
ncbi:hypothetical protein JOF56_005296 [Kibdelosporangium banguiense]|uniref:Uncharacterized protein n=1 Tax=Kibdelosporangium banguiense TaxID=1365924 RepID=A0ABS4TLZ9_9PSEU|nr:hypothetical protein [Kibdelosporangium banguiense]MBP2324911.1 hypothetical protein [Kibdelosporangium banguiense]